MADQYKVAYGLSNGAIFNDLKRPLTQILRSHKYLTLNMALTVQNRHYVYADNWYLVRTSALFIGVILNDLERAGVTCKIFSKQIDSAAYVHTLSALFVEVQCTINSIFSNTAIDLWT